MSNTKIEWADKVWNPVTGCTKISTGCKNCYAERQAKRFWGDRKFTDVQCHEDRLEQPLHWKKPRRIFVNSVSDLFHKDVPFDFIDEVFTVMALCPQHTFIILTKRPERMLEYFKIKDDPFFQQHDIGRAFDGNGSLGRWPDWEEWETPDDLPETPQGFEFSYSVGRDGFIDDNCTIYTGPWPLPNVQLGVSVEDQPTADDRIPLLLQTPAATRIVSYEPALGPVDFTQISFYHTRVDTLSGDKLVDTPIDQIIMGGESGPNARPMHPDWARSVRDQCKAAGVPFYFKQIGEWMPGYICDGGKKIIGIDSKFHEIEGHQIKNLGGEARAIRVGKKAAGHLLAGVEHRELI